MWPAIPQARKVGNPSQRMTEIHGAAFSGGRDPHPGGPRQSPARLLPDTAVQQPLPMGCSQPVVETEPVSPPGPGLWSCLGPGTCRMSEMGRELATGWALSAPAVGMPTKGSMPHPALSHLFMTSFFPRESELVKQWALHGSLFHGTSGLKEKKISMQMLK